LEKDGILSVFHVLHPRPIYLLERIWCDLFERALYGEIPEEMNILIQDLIENDIFITHENADPEELEKTRIQAIRMLSRPNILYLVMSNACNLACTYCPIPSLAKQHGEHLLTFEDAVAGISLWQKHIMDESSDHEPYVLIFYGGEPLLNQKVFRQLLPYIEKEKAAGKLPEKLELMLCTNGLLMDKDLAKLCAQHRITVAIGIDGPQVHNDRIRITPDGSPTFATIQSVIKQLVDEEVRVVASVTITPENVHQIAQYPSLLKNLGISQFGFNLMKGEALLRELNGRSSEEYYRAAAKGVLHGLADRDGDHCFEYQLEKKLTALTNGFPFSLDCTCYGNQLVIQADGQVNNCPFFRINQGHVQDLPDTFRIHKTEIVEKWRQNLPIFHESILSDHQTEMLHGGRCAWGSDENNALFTQEVMYGLIWASFPREQEDMLRNRETTHWNYRGIRPLSITGSRPI